MTTRRGLDTEPVTNIAVDTKAWSKETADKINERGGPKSPLERGIIDLSEVMGNGREGDDLEAELVKVLQG